MLYKETSPNVFEPWMGEVIMVPRTDGKPDDPIKFPLSIEDSWTDFELKEIGLYRPRRDPTPVGKQVVNSTIARIGDTVKVVNEYDDVPDEPITTQELYALLVEKGIIQVDDLKTARSLTQTGMEKVNA